MRAPLGSRGAHLGDFGVGLGAALGGHPRRARIDMRGRGRWPSAGATLDLDFVNQQGYAYGQGIGRIRDLVTISGGAGGTVVGPSGLIVSASAPRFDYDPVSLACKGLLIEEQRTNLLTESEFRNGLADAPDRSGLVTATTLSGFAGALAFGHDGATTSTAYKSNYTTVIGQAYVLSVIVAMDDGLAPTLSNASAASSANSFALVVGNSAPDPNTASIKSLGGGLYRVSIAWTATNASTKVGVVKYATNSARTFKVTGYCLEMGSFATSYIPTTSAAVTRTVDSAVISGAKFTGFFNPTEGTIYAEASPLGITANQDVIYSIYGTSGNRYWAGRKVGGLQDASIVFYVQSGNQDSAAAIHLAAAIAGAPFKLASSYRKDDFASAVAGRSALTDVSGSLPAVTPDRMLIGADAPSPTYIANSHIKRLRYWPRRLSDTELQELTR